MRKTTKRLLCLLFTCLFVLSISISAAADAWIPPDDDCNYNLIASCSIKDECRALNVFASNYAETNIETYYSSDPDVSEAIKGTLKHFELNPGVYPDEVSSFRENGKTYMKLTSDVFVRRVKKLFNCSVAAKNCPGYQPDGDIIVSADNYDATITVFASVRWVDYLGDGEYLAHFDVFRSPSGVSGKYNIPNYDLPGNLSEIGLGDVFFYYFGSPDATTFSSTDFELAGVYITYTEAIPYTNANEPYVPVIVVTVTENPAPEQETASEEYMFSFDSISNYPGNEEIVIGEMQLLDPESTQVLPVERDVIDPFPLPEPGDYRNNTGILILFALILVLSAVIVFLIIFFSVRAKRRKEATGAAQQMQQPYYPQYPQQQYPQQQIPPEQQYPSQSPQQ